MIMVMMASPLPRRYISHVIGYAILILCDVLSVSVVVVY